MTDSAQPILSKVRLKMADIARLSNVSVSTVSRALAGSELIPISLRDKIAAIARENGYVINQAARNLRLRTTRTIGLVLPIGHDVEQEVTDPFMLELIGRVSQEVIRRGYDVLLTKVAAPSPGWLDTLIQSNRLDGVLMLGQGDPHDSINAIAPHYLPLVVWGEQMPGQTYCTVGVDNLVGGRLATEHLIENGRRRIRFIGPLNVPEVASRYAGYLAALKEAGLISTDKTSLETQAIDCHFTHESAHAAMLALLASEPNFDGIFAASDVIAQGAKTAFIERGGRVPLDASFCGFDDVAMAKYLTPPLTTIRQDLSLAARLMIDLLFQRLAGEHTPSQTIPAELVIRGSSVRQV